ncbi:MAG: phosphodiester glycosidase family protein [Oscillospiraceae bacterium]|nr:phosphodiester glycosidase family protein [Oscillospiraceae bacterium]MDY5641670.1 phosphodiester glycosidase family protein [Candidatus Faecousia sp.]
MRGKYEAPPQKRRRKEPAQQPRDFAQSVPNQPRQSKYRKPTLGEHLLRFLAVVLTVVVVFACTLFLSMKMICGSTSPSAKRTFVTTLLETGQLKFLVSWFVPAAEVQEIVNSNSMVKLDEDVDAGLITFEPFEDNEQDPEAKDLEVIELSGRTYTAKLIKVRDPSRISLATIYPWRDTGVTLEELAKQSGAIAAINGGIYDSTNNSGGRPYGVIVSNGEIQYNKPNEYPGLVLVGFDNDNILQIIDVDGMTPAQLEALVEEKGIRDAVTFQEESSDANNHFVQLIINGNPRGMNGVGSGLNPRTAIGQCADGSVLLLVTDGRGKNGHLGASAADLIEIMTQYGAVNAANLDGGSSTCMYYDGEYLMTSVTFYYSNSSWKLPAGFIVK